MHYVVVGTRSACATLDTLSQYRPDLVVLGDDLADLDSIELARRIRRLPEREGMPLLGLVEVKSRYVEEQLLAAGYDEALTKPLDPYRFLQAVWRYLPRAAEDGSLSFNAGEETYRALFHTNPLPCWVFDLESLRFLMVNDAAVAIYGYTREELLRMTLRDIRPEADVHRLHHALTRLERGGSGHVAATRGRMAR